MSKANGYHGNALQMSWKTKRGLANLTLTAFDISPFFIMT